jgi:PAS domain S-box-containing protein
MSPTTKILIVDDEPEILTATARFLAGAGYDTITASSGRQALEIALREKPDLLVLDIIMPDMDGIEVCRRIKSEPSLAATFVALVSGKSMTAEERAEGFDAGASEYILRPFDGEEFLARVRALLRLQRSEKAIREQQRRLCHRVEVLRATRNINQLIVQEKDRDRLIRRVCEHFVETRGFFDAWIALTDDTGVVGPYVEAGLGERFAPLAAMLDQGKFPSCMANALEGPAMVVIRNPAEDCTDCPSADIYGGRDIFIDRLEHGGTTYGVLTASVPHEYADDQEERSLFRAVAKDIAFALRGFEVEEQRNRAVEALKASEAKYRLLAENSADVIWMMTMAGRFTYMSPSVEAATGWTPDEVLAIPMADYLTKGSASKVEKIIAWQLSEPAERRLPSYRIELQQKRKDGSVFDIEVTANWMLDERGDLIGIQGITRDISERKRAEQERESLREQLAQSMKLEAIGRLAGGVAHDFNNMLTVISNYSDMILESLHESNPLRADVLEIRNAAKRAADLTRQLLAFSRKQIIKPSADAHLR